MGVALHYTGWCCGGRNSVVLAPVSQLRGTRRQRVPVPGRGDDPARARADAQTADRLRVLPRQRPGRAARVVVPPPRLRPVVRRRARHAHERGSPHRDPAAGGRAVRLQPQPAERIDRDTTLSFTYDGAPVSAYAGDTIGSALYAGGRRVFSRSFKYHRPRGLLCCSGRCPNCMMTVDGVPNVRVCVEPVREGADVRAQNVLGSLERDLLGVVDKLGGPFTPVGFYYRTMIRPRRAWPLYEKFLRSVAGLGKVGGATHRRYDTEHRSVDVLVIGGGGGGRRAASEAAAEGFDVLLVDEGHAFPGSGYEVLAPARALAVYEGGLVPVDAGGVLYRVRARRIVVAAGALEQPLVFPGNDLVGVVLPQAVRRLVSEWSVQPGSRAVVVGDGTAVPYLERAGVEVAASVERAEQLA